MFVTGDWRHLFKRRGQSGNTEAVKSCPNNCLCKCSRLGTCFSVLVSICIFEQQSKDNKGSDRK